MKRKTIVILCMLLLALAALTACGNGEVSIKTQPASVTVSYPEGATFSVDVKNAENVESYQWYAVDQAGNEFELVGVTAKTASLIVPATDCMGADIDFYCVIKDKAGNEITSETATLSVDNTEESKPVFYVGEYAVEPGETLDLATVDLGDGTKLGSGTVAFDANGTDITLTDVNFDNTLISCDFALSPNVGLCLQQDRPDAEEINVTFVGENRIVNNYYDEDYNAGGIPFDFYFLGDEEKPVVNLIGDGTLEITNGSIALRALSDMMVDVDVTIKQTRQIYGDGIIAENMMIGEGRKLDLEVFGSAIQANGNLFISGAEINVKAGAPHVSMGIATKNVIQGDITLNAENSKITIESQADPEICAGIAGYTGLSAGGEMFLTNSDISYTVNALPKEEVYASNFIGLSAASIDVDGTRLAIKADTEDIFNMYGLYADEYVVFENSEATFDIKTSGPVYGIAPEGDFSSDNSKVTVNVANYDKFAEYGGTANYGIMCGSFVMKADEPDQLVTVKTAEGMAVGCNLEDTKEEKAAYQEGYEASHFVMRDDSAIQTPADSVISTGSVEQGDESYRYYIWVETVYSKADTSKPAAEAVFGNK